MPNSYTEDDEQQEQFNIVTLFRYVLGEESSSPQQQVVVGPAVVGDLAFHIGTGTQSGPPASGANQPVNEGASTSSGVEHCQDPPPIFRTLQCSLQQLVGVAGYHHILHPRLTWEDFT